MTRPDFERILIIATRQIGDVLCTTPLIRRARELWPKATIDVLGYEKTMGMLVGNSDLNEVIETPERPRVLDYRKLLTRILRKYDFAVVTQPGDRAHFYGLFAAPIRVGIVPSKTSHNWWKRALSLHSVELDYWRQHVVIERLRLLEPFDPVTVRDVFVSPPFSTMPTDSEDFSLPASGTYAVIHPCPKYRFKEWPVQHWIDLVSGLIGEGLSVFVTGSGESREVSVGEKIISGLPPSLQLKATNLCGKLPFERLSALLAGARLFVGVDTAVTHLAASTGVRTLALFGPTPPANFGPWPLGATVNPWNPAVRSVWNNQGKEMPSTLRIQTNGNVSLLQGAGACVPCRQMGCQKRHDSDSDCLTNLKPGWVLKELKK